MSSFKCIIAVLREMNDYFHQCLAVCRNLHNQGVSLNPEINPHAAAITADKLIYSYAIEMVGFWQCVCGGGGGGGTTDTQNFTGHVGNKI